MRTALVVAVASNGVIGRDNTLPWRISGDLRHFRRITLGKPVVMGRRTFEAISKPLDGRTNIVVTRDRNYRPVGIVVCHCVDEALAAAARVAHADGQNEIMVIGGGELYAAVLPRADRVYLTEVHQAVDGDVRFPPLDPSDWHEAAREDHEENGTRYSFVMLDRVKDVAAP